MNLISIGILIISILHVNHLDGNTLNNRWDNLEWCTPFENAMHGMDVIHTMNHIPIEVYKEILKLLEQGCSFRSIHRRMNVSASTVRKIKNRERKRYLMYDRILAEKE